MKTFGKIVAITAGIVGAAWVGHKYGDNIISGTKSVWGKVFTKKAEASCEQPAPETKAE